MISIISRTNLLLPFAALTLLGATSFATTGTTLTTGVDTNNNIVQTANGTVDTNWKFAGYYDSYGLTRGQVFGSNVSNASGAIGYNISSAATSAATTGPANTAAVLVTGADRPGWYNPGTGAQWLAPTADEANAGIPINPPGNYEYQMNLSPYISTTGGLATITITGLSADNHYELAIGNSTSEEYLAKPFATQETWNTAGNNLQITFSPLDGTTLDLIVANNNDQTNSAGQYVYDKNPTGFIIKDLTVSQASGPTPKQDKLVSAISVNGAVTPGSGVVYRSLVAAPEPATWAIMASFLLIVLCKAGSREAIRE
jgi:hypothetical protein